jgi:hypothetical protein
MTPCLYPSPLNISIDRVPQLTDKNWDEWDGILCSILAPSEGALEIMMGEARMGGNSYDSTIDEALLAVIDRKVDSSLYFVIIGFFQGKGAYSALQAHYDNVHAPSIKQHISQQVSKLQQDASDSFIDYAVRALELREEAIDAKLFRKEFTASQFVKDFYHGIKTDERNNHEAGHLIHVCQNEFDKIGRLLARCVSMKYNE